MYGMLAIKMNDLETLQRVTQNMFYFAIQMPKFLLRFPHFTTPHSIRNILISTDQLFDLLLIPFLAKR